MSNPDPDHTVPNERSLAARNDILDLTTEIVASYVGNASHIQASEIPELIRSVRAALSESEAPQAAEPEKAPKMAKAQWSKLVTPDGIKSLLDGKLYKTLKRTLTRNGHTPASYREAHGLPDDFPMVAPNYSAARSKLARDAGLGARGRSAKAKPGSKAPAKRASKGKAPVGES